MLGSLYLWKLPHPSSQLFISWEAGALYLAGSLLEACVSVVRESAKEHVVVLKIVLQGTSCGGLWRSQVHEVHRLSESRLLAAR